MGEKEKKEGKKIKLTTFVLSLIIMALICVILTYAAMNGLIGGNKNEKIAKTDNTKVVEQKTTPSKQSEENIANRVVGKKLCDFDLSFLKQENKEVNKIYSPLSIKAALKMLEEGAEGEAKAQISQYIGEYTPTNYKTTSNRAFANALFVRDTYKVKDSYKTALKTKYNAEVISDSFTSPKNVNNWVSKNTLNLLNDLVDEIDESTNFILINALGIDMEWKDKFLIYGDGGIETCGYEHENFAWHVTPTVIKKEFNNKSTVSGMEIAASINNYDIVKELGEDNIRKTVGTEYKKWAKSLPSDDWDYKETFNSDLSDENVEKNMNEYLDNYIKEIDGNYHDASKNTEFSLYVDENVKVFAKDLKEYDETTLEYIGIMPIKEDLSTYIEKTDATKINNIISNLKEIKYSNFKEGIVTEITGFIPKFDFEYELKLKDDLEKMGIKNIFEQGKANLTNISDGNDLFISSAIHKANIEFTQDGIKAAAATLLGGAGAGEPFNYYYDVPVEKIDLTFDKPYMFLIRDKQTGEIWFTGTVYEPLLWENEPEKDLDYRS